MFHRRPLCLCALGVLCGVWLGVWLPADVRYLSACILALTAVGSALLSRRRAAVCVLFAAMALLRTASAALPAVSRGEAVISGRIAELPQQSGTHYTVILDDVSYNGAPLAGRLRLIAEDIPSPRYGQRVTAQAGTFPPSEAFLANDRYRGVVGTAVVRKGTYAATGAETDLYGRLLALRTAVGERVEALFPKNGAVARSMLLGDKTSLDEDARLAFERAGLLHLFAASGLHVSILAGAVAYLSRGRAWTRLVVVGVFLLFYAVLTAFSPSVLRAGVMLMVSMMAIPLRRRADTLSALALSGMLILAVNPFALFYGGFQLSFVAVYGLALLGPMLRRAFRGLGNAASSVLSANISATVATAPFVCAFFGRMPLIGIAANALVLPMGGAALRLTASCTALSYLLPSAAALMARGADAVLSAVVAVAQCGGAFILVPAPGTAAKLLWLAAMLAGSQLLLRPIRTRQVCLTFAFLLSILCWVVI